MTGPLAGLDSTAFNAVFDTAKVSVFRWEGHPVYAVPDTDASLAAYRSHAPRPERSVRTSPWLRRIALQTAAGVTWSRVRRVGEPLSEYDRWSLLAYVESQAVGEQVHIARPELRLNLPDFWLIDAHTKNEQAVVMHYDEDGRLLLREKVTSDERLDELVAGAGAGLDASVPLNVWLAEQEVKA